jgi:regulatory protein
MIVTKIEYQKRDPSRVNLFIDKSFYSGISLNTLASEALYEGMEISQEVLDRIVEIDMLSRFLTRVTDYIARSPKTEFQVMKYLKDLRFKKKGLWFDEDISINWDEMFDTILNKLKDYKYIDDENYARLFVEGRLKSRPRGKSVLVGELMSKGVSKEIAERVCNEEVTDEYQLLKSTFEKKYRGKRFDSKDSKMVNFLLRKGFSWDLIERLKQDES